MVAGTSCQRELGTLGWQRSEKGEKQVECTSLGGKRDGAEGRHLELGGIKDQTVYGCVSQLPGRGPVPDPGINYTGPREVHLEFVILVF